MAENQNPGQGGQQGQKSGQQGISNRPDDEFQNDRDANRQGEQTRGRQDEKEGQSNQQGQRSGQQNQGGGQKQ
jgi:hypothetical protein